MPDETYQSLYRRYRPQRFEEVRGQEHVVTALGNAVRHGRVAHAYLFSGPRGTGKTSTARILAKALNCTALEDGEPCGRCDSCVAVQAGSSLDVIEIDAASNNGVDAMRDLVSRAALGSPGRRKVYIIDEVHMLSAAASNALLKTLEGPPAHVVFVLATTDPQKVLETITSRTQHFAFKLLAPDVLSALLGDVNDDASLGLDADTLDRVVLRGNGSARDALSALDQAAAAGGAPDEVEPLTPIVDAIAARDVGGALAGVAQAIGLGQHAHGLAVGLVAHLRSAFLVTMAPAVAGVPEHQRAALDGQARRLGPAALVRAMEVLGEALIHMRDALDSRVTLEVALIRLCVPGADTSSAAIVERLEVLERRVGALLPLPTQPSPPVAGPPAHEDPPPGVDHPAPAGPRRTIGDVRRRPASPGDGRPVLPATSEGQRQPVAAAHGVDRDRLTQVWGDEIFPTLVPALKALYRAGRWSAVNGNEAVFVLPSHYRDRAEARRLEVEDALARHFGGRLVIRFDIEEATQPAGAQTAPGGMSSVGPGSPPGGGAAQARSTMADDELSAAEIAQLEDAPDAPRSVQARLLEMFPGAEEVPG